MDRYDNDEGGALVMEMAVQLLPGDAPACCRLPDTVPVARLVRDPIASQAISTNPDPVIRFPIPNERELRKERLVDLRKNSGGARKIAFAADGSHSIIPKDLPFKPPGGAMERETSYDKWPTSKRKGQHEEEYRELNCWIPKILEKVVKKVLSFLQKIKYLPRHSAIFKFGSKSMGFQMLPRNSVISTVKNGSFPNTCQGVLKHYLVNEETVSKLFDRRWALSCPDTKINQIMISNRKGGGSICAETISYQNIAPPCLGEDMLEKKNHFPSFYVVRDDLLHPLVNGNKARKLDALLPVLEDNAVTGVVTCGGCQSAHTAAVAVSCAERGLKAHLLLRGEEPETLTGYNLVSRLYGDVVYVPRSIYAKREEMLANHAESIVGGDGSIIWLNDVMKTSFEHHENFPKGDPFNFPEKPKKLAIINEGAGDAVALLGVMRLIKYLSQNHLFGKKQAMKIVVDAGTGTTAVGLALGALALGLPWEVTAVMLADKIDGYKRKERSLISEFLTNYTSCAGELAPCEENAGIVQWVERRIPRRFGNILKGEVEECRRIAQQTGILVDPIYTLAGWDLATQLSQNDGEDAKIAMLHTGGTLGMFGLAQRYKSYF
ncbi:Pyridoxal-5'-phosphate-dependent enzyme family protein [Perilla frutescens var. hirtella]|uniref:Pyridoxal-5'-phosphate-dependent enzyme family protein n=1 Tax=Perilla frutescens var. hirtella TaxID=608512 RepID=A0AAD4J3X7_PERFH|nr:Pyridoxal-5'-phosphate-dependent enzyme family protein [Perilla frutescens var. hirtella]